MGKRIVAILLLLMLIFATVTTALAVEKVNVSGTRYVDTKGNGSVNIRKGPSTKKDLTALAKVPNGAKVTLHKMTVTGKWYYVDYNGKYGWIQSSYLSTTKPKTLADKVKEELKKKVEPMKEKILDMAKSHPYICGIDGCTAKAEKIFGEWRFAQVKGEHGEYYYREERFIHVVCEKGHNGGYWQYRYK